jgi:hypothetical protein
MVLDVEIIYTSEPTVGGHDGDTQGASDPSEHHIGMLDALALLL